MVHEGLRDQKSEKFDEILHRFLESLLEVILERFGCQKGAKIMQKWAKVAAGRGSGDFSKIVFWLRREHQFRGSEVLKNAP